MSNKLKEEAKKFYDDKRILWETENITGNDNPDYSEPFYQEIFNLMVDFHQRQSSPIEQRLKEAVEIINHFVNEIPNDNTYRSARAFLISPNHF